MSSAPVDLVILVPCKDLEQVVQVLIGDRVGALGSRRMEYEVVYVPMHDPAVRTKALGLLSPYVGHAARALVLIDRHGSGAEDRCPEQIETEVEASISRDWADGCAAVCIDPELEAWIWSDPGVLARTLPAIRPSLTREDVERAAQANAPAPDEDHEEAFRRTLAQLNVKASQGHFVF